MKIKPENRFWIGIYGFTAFIMLVAVSVFAWLAWTSKEEPGVGRVAGTHPLPGANNTLPEESYALLAAFDAPAYVPERGSKAVPKEFSAAMTEYANHNYAAAAAELRKIGDANPGFTPARFYLGISLLLANDRIAGIQELNELASAEDDPYLERARFYLAKALIGEHDLPRAQQQLKDVIAQHGQLENQAAALLNQILQT